MEYSFGFYFVALTLRLKLNGLVMVYADMQ